MQVSGQLHTPATSLPREIVPITTWRGGWMGLDTVEKKKKSRPCYESNLPHQYCGMFRQCENCWSAEPRNRRATEEERLFIARCYVTHATVERVAKPRPPHSLLRNTEVKASLRQLVDQLSPTVSGGKFYSELSPWVSRLLLWQEGLCGILEECMTYSCASRSVAGRRLVEQENPSACATADSIVCKREINRIAIVYV
jgi:hypothetical protein